MSFSVIALIKAIILPPTINFILIVVGLLNNKHKVLSRVFVSVGFLTLLLFCFTPFSHFLLKSLEKNPALIPPVTVNDEQAIVVLSGGSFPDAKEYGKAIDGSDTLERDHYAAFLYKQTALPILVSGGRVGSNRFSEASVMADTLKNSFNIDVTWKEENSINTAENAIYSAKILKANGINTIFLVTHAWHMSRAEIMFERQGIKVTPAPTIFTPDLMTPGWQNYFPSVSALYQTRIALHEYLGMFWYKLRY